MSGEINMKNWPKFIKGPITGLLSIINFAIVFLVLSLVAAGLSDISNGFRTVYRFCKESFELFYESKELTTLFIIEILVFLINLGMNVYNAEESINMIELGFNHLVNGLAIALGIYYIIKTGSAYGTILFAPCLIAWPVSYRFLGLGSKIIDTDMANVGFPGLVFFITSGVLIVLFALNSTVALILSIILSIVGIGLIILMTLKNGRMVDNY